MPFILKVRDRIIAQGNADYDPHFFDRAACVGENTDTFFPQSGPEAATAKKICATCPVRFDCLIDSLTAWPSRDYGIYGGCSPRTRKVLADELHIEADEFNPVVDYFGHQWGINARNKGGAPAIDEECADRMLEMHEAGMSLGDIARDLNARQVPMARGGIGGWQRTTVRRAVQAAQQRKAS